VSGRGVKANGGGALDRGRVDVVLFDYGNTLIEFTRPQIDRTDAGLAAELRRLFGPFDESAFRRHRDHDRRAPYSAGYRERPIERITAELVRALFDVEPTEAEVAGLVECRRRHFVESIEAPAGAGRFLGALGERYRLGVISNYPCGRSVRDSLSRVGLGGYFETVVVSADVGYVKPHPGPFEAALGPLGVEPGRAVYVGDNWLGDVQGAKRLGMQAVHTVEYETSEHFEPAPGDHEPDLVIERLEELEAYLLGD